MDFLDTIQRGFRTANVPNDARDWNHWCYLSDWDMGRWHDAVIRDLKIYKEHPRFREAEVLADLAVDLVLRSRNKGYVEPKLMEDLVQDIQDVLKEVQP